MIFFKFEVSYDFKFTTIQTILSSILEHVI